MSFGIETEPGQDGQALVMRLHGSVTYEEAPRLHEALFRAIETGDANSLRVDLSAVERIDTAGLAVLIEGLMATRKRHPRLELCSPSPAVEKMFQLAGFVSLMSEQSDARFYDALRRCCGDDPLRRRGLGAARREGSSGSSEPGEPGV